MADDADALEHAAFVLLSTAFGLSLATIKTILPVPLFAYNVVLRFSRALYHLIFQLTYSPSRVTFASEHLDNPPRPKDDLPGHDLYEYTPLSGDRSIRLLEIKHPNPWSFDADSKILECNLVHVSLDKPMLAYPYRAISYTWDNQERDRYILCGGKKLAVTKNCELVLQHFMQYARLHIWIDAICIDQESAEEKAMQIPLMAEIYGRALGVNVWLGLPTPATGLAVSYVWLSWCLMSVPIRFKSWVEIQLHRLARRRGHIVHIEDLVHRNWWRRVWTIQECVLARESGWTAPVPVFVNCGHHEMPMDCLSHLLMQFNVLHHFFGHSPYVFNTSVWNHYILSHSQPRLSVFSPDSEKGSISREITTAMFRCRASSVFDDRDRIYGLYGVFTRLGITLSKPDYAKSREELYEEFTRQACQSTHSLDLLCLVNNTDSSLQDPSWVPDFSAPFRLGDMWLSRNDKTPTSPRSDTAFNFSFHPDGKSLRCTAILIDKVAHKTGMSIWKPADHDAILRHEDGDLVNLQDPTHSTQTTLTFMQWVYLLVTYMDQLSRRYETKENALLAFGNVLTTGHLRALESLITITNPLQTVSSWIGTFVDAKYRNELFDGLVDDLDVSPEVRGYIRDQLAERGVEVGDSWKTLCVLKFYPIVARFTHTVWMHNEDKVLFVTEGGWLGSGNMSLREGDAVFRLAGLDRPMLMRLMDDAWKVVGPAFVEGVIDGEVWCEGEAEEILIV
ncbi:heterokaryon incompatibility protein-domain-containing protein [Immersiella caudata]|uniref:Heterokaryon incompatibility protein-domain-containing protein n=1 Tax=Immersiella caudata TaxID=314043 RepID=A0AA39U842_9PEZI|nr:heterokaryon incompatibility protein-domain-containing protein [Immersiella caudata]